MSPELGMIRVTVRLHSILRHCEGRIVDRLELEVPPASTVRNILALLEVDEALEPILAVNDAVAEEDWVLVDGDHLAIIPAVAGG